MTNQNNNNNVPIASSSTVDVQESIASSPSPVPVGSIRHRGNNWSEEEDKQLCESWVVISEDPITGRDQRREQMWVRIHRNYHEYIGSPSTRNITSLQNRWAVINRDVTNFNAQMIQMVNLNRSGFTEVDNVRFLHEHLVHDKVIYCIIFNT